MAAASPSDPFAVQAWRSALEQVEQDCGSDVVGKLIMQETKPGHLLDYIQQRQEKESRSKFSKLLGKISTMADVLDRFQSALDVISQGTPQPGCLLWGSIRLVLEVRNWPFLCLSSELSGLSPTWPDDRKKDVRNMLPILFQVNEINFLLLHC